MTVVVGGDPVGCWKEEDNAGDEVKVWWALWGLERRVGRSARVVMLDEDPDSLLVGGESVWD